ncbi:TPA: YjjG family noncanonical pyrimidine nucleotidase [Streptococcus suis]
MHYKHILFDLDHTLLDFARGEELALTQFLQAMDVTDIRAFKDVYRPINQAMWKNLEKGLISKKELIDTRFSKTFAQFGRQVDGRQMALTYQEFIGKQGQIFTGADQLLRQLTQNGYQLYAATNGITYIQENRLHHSPIQQYFTDVFISEKMGTQKPAAAFFDKIAEQVSGGDKTSLLMVGDSLTADIQGANNAGIDSVWYNPTKQINHGPAQPTYTISHYSELFDILSIKE